jgi:hypothetical protein
MRLSLRAKRSEANPGPRAWLWICFVASPRNDGAQASNPQIPMLQLGLGDELL